jgi:hypothetical protein
LPGESAGGVSPPAALRTGRDGLPSSGPHSPACGECDELPVCEQARLVLVDLLQPVHRSGVLAAESLELVHGPPGEVLVDTPCQEAQLGAVEGSVIVDPALDLGIDLLGQAEQVRATAAALPILALRAVLRTTRPAPCRSSRPPSVARNTGPSVRSPMARSIARAVRGASGIATTLPPLRVIVSVRCPRYRPRCSNRRRWPRTSAARSARAGRLAHARPAAQAQQRPAAGRARYGPAR